MGLTRGLGPGGLNHCGTGLALCLQRNPVTRSRTNNHITGTRQSDSGLHHRFILLAMPRRRIACAPLTPTCRLPSTCLLPPSPPPALPVPLGPCGNL